MRASLAPPHGGGPATRRNTPDEPPRVSGEGSPLELRHPGAPGPVGDQRGRGAFGRGRARGGRVDGQGPGPRGRSRKGGRRQAGGLPRRSLRTGRDDARCAARDEADDGRGPAGLHRPGRIDLRHRARVLSEPAGRSGPAPDRDHGVGGGRDGHRGSGGHRPREDRHRVPRPGGRTPAVPGTADRIRARARLRRGASSSPASSTGWFDCSWRRTWECWS